MQAEPPPELQLERAARELLTGYWTAASSLTDHRPDDKPGARWVASDAGQRCMAKLAAALARVVAARPSMTLDPDEIEVVRRYAAGMRTKAIAGELGTSESGARAIIARVAARHAVSPEELVGLARREGLI